MTLPKKEAMVLVFDAGKTSFANPEFFSKSKQCLSRILERKILLHSQDEVGIVLVGSEESGENSKHVSCPFDLQEPSWDMVRFVRNKLDPTEHKANWLYGVVLAADKLSESPLKQKKIVLLSNLLSEITIKDPSVVVEHLKMMGLTMTIIGPNDLSENLEEEEEDEEEVPCKRSKTDTAEISPKTINFLNDLSNQLKDNCEIVDVDSALHHLILMPMKQTKSKAWNAELHIANIKIPVSAYVKVSRNVKKPITRTRGMISSEEQGGVSKLPPQSTNILQRVIEKSYVDQEGAKVVVAAEETTEGVKYGNTLLPFTADDKAAMKYRAGEKGIKVLFFTKLANLNLMFLMGEGCHVVVAPKGNSEAAVTLSALIQSLQKSERAAVAKKVYSTDRGLRLVVLSPVREEIETDGKTKFRECLVVNDLAWKESVKKITFQPFFEEISSEQLTAVEELVDAMNLMKVKQGSECYEAFRVETLHEEKNAYYLQCLIDRAVNPDAPLPNPSAVDNSAVPWGPIVEDCLQKVKEKFPITIIEEKKEKNEFFRQRYLKMKENGNEVMPPPPPPPQLNHPKPVLNENDPDSVRDVKTLFIDHILPPTRALIYTLKIHLTSSSEKAQIFSSLKECIRNLHEFSRSAQFYKYNGWFDDLYQTSPDIHDIAEMISSLRESYGYVGGEPHKPNNQEQMELDALRDLSDIERSQLLTEIF